MKKMLALMMILGLGMTGCSSSSSADASSEELAQKTDEAIQADVKTPAGQSKLQADLDATGRRLVAQAASHVQPSKANKRVSKIGGEYVATYTEVDQQSMTTSMRDGSKGAVGFIRYQENIYECRGSSKSAALSAPCKVVKTRNVNEMIIHNGKQWMY